MPNPLYPPCISPGMSHYMLASQPMPGRERACLHLQVGLKQSFLEASGVNHRSWQLPWALFHCSLIMAGLQATAAAEHLGVTSPSHSWCSLDPWTTFFLEGGSLYTAAEVKCACIGAYPTWNSVSLMFSSQ